MAADGDLNGRLNLNFQLVHHPFPFIKYYCVKIYAVNITNWFVVNMPSTLLTDLHLSRFELM